MLTRRPTKQGLLAVAKLSALAGVVGALPVALLNFGSLVVQREFDKILFAVALFQSALGFALGCSIAMIVLLLISLVPSVIRRESQMTIVAVSVSIALVISLLFGVLLWNEHDTLAATLAAFTSWIAMSTLGAALEGALLHRLFRQSNTAS